MEGRALAYARAFAALGRERHFGRAAAALGLAQSSVSRQIADLEGLLGYALFRRTTRRVELTSAGERLWRGVVEGLKTMDAAAGEAAELARGRRGLIRLGCTRMGMMRIGARTIQALRRDFPDLTLDLHELSTNDQVTALQRGELDFGLLHPPVSSAELRIEPMGDSPLVLVAATDHSLAAEKTLGLVALRDEPMILYPRSVGPVLYDAVIACCAQAGFSPVIVQHCTSWEAAIDLAVSGLGVAWAPRLLAERRRDGAAILDVVTPLPLLQFALATRRDGADPSVRALLERFRTGVLSPAA